MDKLITSGDFNKLLARFESMVVEDTRNVANGDYSLRHKKRKMRKELLDAYRLAIFKYFEEIRKHQ